MDVGWQEWQVGLVRAHESTNKSRQQHIYISDAVTSVEILSVLTFDMEQFS